MRNNLKCSENMNKEYLRIRNQLSEYKSQLDIQQKSISNLSNVERMKRKSEGSSYHLFLIRKIHNIEKQFH